MAAETHGETHISVYKLKEEIKPGTCPRPASNMTQSHDLRSHKKVLHWPSAKVIATVKANKRQNSMALHLRDK